MRIYAGLACTLLLQGPGRIPEAPSPVHWHLAQTFPGSAVAGEEFHAVAIAAIDPGWHLYALEEPEDGPSPLEFSTPAEGPAALVSVGADRPVRAPEPGRTGMVSYYRNRARFTLRLRLRPSARLDTALATLPVGLRVRYQACNDRMCLPPRVEALAFPVPVAGN